MTKRHYQQIAAVLSKHADPAAYAAAGDIRLLAEQLADVFAADNPRFDRARFMRAVFVNADGRDSESIGIHYWSDIPAEVK